MSVLKNFENAPRSLGLGATGVLSPKQRATGPQYNFFLNLQRGPWPGVCGGRGACRPTPPRATGGLPPYISPGLHASIPFSFEPKNCTKNSEKKRGVRRRKAAKLCRIAHL